MTSAEVLLARLSQLGMRLTRERRLLVRSIAAKKGPFGPEHLVDEFRSSGVGRATVYRTLERMERLGLLSRIHVGSDQGYTVCDQSHHHHLVCAACHRVVPIDASSVERAIQALAARLQCRIETHMLEFAGACPQCLRDHRSG